jgi:Tfp pilus assembly protein PilF
VPLLASACLTTKSAKNPGFRGLTASEAGKLEGLNDSSWENMKSIKPEKGESLADLNENAATFLHNGDYEQSILTYSKILSKEPERYDICYKLRLALLLSGKLGKAKTELAEVLLHKTDMPEVHEALGVVYLKENHFAAAQKEFRSALALDPKRFQSRFYLGETCLRANQYSQALPEFQAALELAPRSDRVMISMGWTMFKQKNYDQGLQWLKKAQALNPDNPSLNYRLGMVLAAQKKFPEALAAFRNSGDEAQAYNNIGVHYYLDHRYEEAARCFQKALDLRPTFYQEAKVNLEKTLARLHEATPAAAEPPERKSKKLSMIFN